MTKIQEYITSLVSQIDIAKKEKEAEGIYTYFNDLLEVDFSGDIPTYFPDFYEKYVANKIIKYLQSYGYTAPNYESWLKKISPKMIKGWKAVDEKMANLGLIVPLNEYVIAAELSDDNSLADKIMKELLDITNDPNLVNSMKGKKSNIDISGLENKLRVVYHILEYFILKRKVDALSLDDLKAKVLDMMSKASNTKIETLKTRIDYPDFPSFMIPVFQNQISSELQKIMEAEKLVSGMDLNLLRRYLYEAYKVDDDFLAIIDGNNKNNSLQANLDNEITSLEEMKSILAVIEALKTIKSLPEFKELVSVFLDRQASMNKLTQIRRKQMIEEFLSKDKKRKKKDSEVEESFENYIPIFSEKSELFTNKSSELFKSIIASAMITDAEKNSLIRAFNDSLAFFTRAKTSGEFIGIFNQRIELIIEKLFNMYVNRRKEVNSINSNPLSDTVEDIEQKIEELKSLREQLLSGAVSSNCTSHNISVEELAIYQEVFDLLKDDPDTLELFEEDLKLSLKKETV